MSQELQLLKEYDGIAIIDRKNNVSYSELLCRINFFSKYTPHENHARTIIFSENRIGWIYSLFAIWNNHGIAVPVDAMVSFQEFVYILRDCQPFSVWTNSKKKDFVYKALQEAQLNVPVMLMDNYESLEISTEEKCFVSYAEDDTSLIIYTSGTTGNPKGVMLSFRNIMANVYSVSRDVHIYRPELRTMILLPLHHVLPLMGSVVAPLVVGGGVAIAPSMNAVDVMNTMQHGKVGIVIGVPRFWTMFYRGIKKKIDSSVFTKALFGICKKVDNSSFSKFVFKSVRKKMGGHITFCVSGGAALEKEIGIGLRVLGLDVLEGYGMSETAPMISFTRPDDIIPGCVGKPMPDVSVEIRDSEIFVKGPNVMQGYYNNPDATSSVIGEDGFLRTGDLGYFDKQGRLYITGRCKEIIVLSNGKNINPAEIESMLDKYSEYVKESAVLQEGDMLKAIIVPQPAYWNKSDSELDMIMRTAVLQYYNETVPSYKKIINFSIYRGDLPRTRLDKIQRFKLKSLLNETIESPQVIIEPTFSEYQILKNYISKEKNKPVRPTDHLEYDLAFDSLDKVGLQGFLEYTFGIKIEQERLSKFQNVVELAEYICDYKSFIEQDNIDWKDYVKKDIDGIKLPSTWYSGVLGVKMFELGAKKFFNLKIEGLENLPRNQAAIFAVNHQSYLDGMFVMSCFKSSMIRDTFFYAKEEHVSNWLVRFVAQKHNVIVLKSTNIKKSIMQLSKVLRMGKNIIIFPEGTRTHDGCLSEFKKTFAILSKELNIPVVPVCISGAFEAMPRGSRRPLRRSVKVSFLPVKFPEVSDSYESITLHVHQAIDDKLQSSRHTAC